MKPPLTSAFGFVFTCLVLTGCAESGTTPDKTPDSAPASTPRPGGFSKLTPSDAGAQTAGRAVAAKVGDGWSLGSIITAQSQVVAGTNYKLTLNLTKDGEKTKVVTATVWRKLDGIFEVTQWKWN